jgi:hypothetical protein
MVSPKSLVKVPPVPVNGKAKPARGAGVVLMMFKKNKDLLPLTSFMWPASSDPLANKLRTASAGDFRNAASLMLELITIATNVNVMTPDRQVFVSSRNKCGVECYVKAQSGFTFLYSVDLLPIYPHLLLPICKNSTVSIILYLSRSIVFSLRSIV